MAEENSHSMIVAGAAAAAAGEATVGTITLPADGPWIIHTVFGQVVSATATAAEAVTGFMRVESAAGDIEPNPAPARFPVYEGGSTLGATIDQSRSPLCLYDVDWVAEGRSVLNMIFNNRIATTGIPQAVLGIMFGRTRPEKRPIKFIDSVATTVTAAIDTAVGTITLSERASKITGLLGVLMQDGVLTTAEELIGFWRMTSDDLDLVPAQYPFNDVYGAGLGALINAASPSAPKFIPVDIPVPKGGRINCFVDLNTAVTNAASVEIYIAYE